MRDRIIEEEREMLDEPVTFCTNKVFLKVGLRPSRSVIIEGETFRKLAIKAVFRNGIFQTRDKWIVDELRNLVGKSGFKNLYTEAPSKEQIRKAEIVKDKITAMADKIRLEVDKEFEEKADQDMAKAKVDNVETVAKAVTEVKMPKKPKGFETLQAGLGKGVER